MKTDYDLAEEEFEQKGELPEWVIIDPFLLEEMAGVKPHTPFGRALEIELDCRCDGDPRRRPSLQY